MVRKRSEMMMGLQCISSRHCSTRCSTPYKGVELDMHAKIAGMLAGSKAELHAGIAFGGEDNLALSASA
jgi:hypothetical protein